jgi:hypothetical protein
MGLRDVQTRENPFCTGPVVYSCQTKESHQLVTVKVLGKAESLVDRLVEMVSACGEDNLCDLIAGKFLAAGSVPKEEPPTALVRFVASFADDDLKNTIMVSPE